MNFERDNATPPETSPPQIRVSKVKVLCSCDKTLTLSTSLFFYVVRQERSIINYIAIVGITCT